MYHQNKAEYVYQIDDNYRSRSCYYSSNRLVAMKRHFMEHDQAGFSEYCKKKLVCRLVTKWSQKAANEELPKEMTDGKKGKNRRQRQCVANVQGGAPPPPKKKN